MQTLVYQHPANGLSRRAWLRLGGLCGLGLVAPPRALRAADAAAGAFAGFGRARSVLLVFCNGGQSQLDIWDPKPKAPLEVRGQFSPIPTAALGVSICEHLPQTAKVADRLTLVRSMSHEDLDHGSAVYLSLTGCYHPQRSSNPPPSPGDAPSLGAVLRRLRPGSRFTHDAVHVNGPALLPDTPGPGQDGGLLGRACEPLVVGDVTDAGGALPGLALQLDLPLGRLDKRLALLHALDQSSRRLAGRQEAQDVDRAYAQALAMLASANIREAFNLEAEPGALRDRYGRHRSGQALLLGRRLVEAGVPLVNVIWNHSNRGQDVHADDADAYGWDTHNDIFTALADRLLPRFDQSFSALVEDLDQRGLLEETLLVCMGEFGRAPRVALEPTFAGATPGRKHWPTVYTIALAGAGVQRGAVVGASDRLGAHPATQPYGPWDVAATMFNALGIPPWQHYSDPFGRSFPVSLGRPIEAAYNG